LYAVFGDASYKAFLEELGTVDLSYGEEPPTHEALVKHRRLLDLLGASVILSSEPLDGFIPVGRRGRAYVYRNPAAFPRAWVANRRERQSGVAALLNPRLDLRCVALVAEDAMPVADVTLDTWSTPAGPPPSSQQCAAAPREARVVRDAGARVQVQATGPGVLVLADRWDPDWQATVGGAPAPVLRVDGILRGVSLPPGRHTVTFSYRSDGLALGLRVAAVAALLVVGVAGTALVGAIRGARIGGA
jgi:hypothetical protein